MSIIVGMVTMMVLSSQVICDAGGGGNIGGSAVGGVAIDTDGVLLTVEKDVLGKVLKARQKALGVTNGDIDKFSKMRKVSLRALENTIRTHYKKNIGHPLPPEIKYLAGLQRIDYVFVYPEYKDIVLVGPGEGWKLNKRGEVVGKTTNMPVLQLEDLVIALRASRNMKNGISCSIDPTAEGVKRFNTYMSKQKTFRKSVADGIVKAMGPQKISLSGLPTNSHFARVMVVADFRMKQYAMGLKKSPVKGMPSYLSMLKRQPRAIPRWWIAPDYKSIQTDGNGLAWKLNSGMKVLTEDEFRDKDGAVKGLGKKSPLAEKWAKTMTSKFSELSKKDSIFAQLQNCIDLAVVAALIEKENLGQKAGYNLDLFLDSGAYFTSDLNAPKQVDSHVSLAKRSRKWIITVSGGVQAFPHQIAAKQEKSDKLQPIRKEAAKKDAKNWWWN